jgi:hypothetical protein
MHHSSFRSLHCDLASFVLVGPSCTFVPAAEDSMHYTPYLYSQLVLGSYKRRASVRRWGYVPKLTRELGVPHTASLKSVPVPASLV